MLLTACATNNQQPLKIANTPTIQKYTNIIQDLHPIEEKKRETFIYLITNERYDIFRSGNIATEPSALDLLGCRIQEHLGAQTPVQIKVHHFVVYANMQISLRAGAFGALLGPLGAVIATKATQHGLNGSVGLVDPQVFANTNGDNEWKRGLSDINENTENGGTIVTWLDVEINGKRIYVRDVSPLKVPVDKVPYALAMEAV